MDTWTKRKVEGWIGQSLVREMNRRTDAQKDRHLEEINNIPTDRRMDKQSCIERNGVK